MMLYMKFDQKWPTDLRDIFLKNVNGRQQQLTAILIPHPGFPQKLKKNTIPGFFHDFTMINNVISMTI